MELHCDRKDDIAEIKEDIKSIKSDVRSLLEFKWRVIGSTVAILTAVTIGINIYSQIKK